LAADLEHVMLDLGFSPREHLKLLRDLFPEAEGTEKGMSVTGTFSAPREEVASGEKPTSHVSHADLSRGSGGGMTGPTPTPGSSPSPSPSPSPSSVSTVSAATTRSGRVVDGGPTGDPRAATSRKTILTTVAIVTAVALAAVPLLLRLRGDDAAHIEATTMTVRRVEVLPTSVRLSLDSNPQDAEVIQVDSGRVLGRTPFTTSLPRATNVIVFRVEKVGHAPALYKIIPDLDKTVRVDLIPIPVALPSPAPARSAPPAPVATRAPAGKRERGARSSAAAAAKTARVHAATSKDCSVTIGSLPWAELWIDGKDVGQPTPVVHLPVTCGHHKVRFKRDNPEIDHVESITVTAGQEFKQNFKLASADSDG
jgi:hypothetical protein